MTDFVAGDWIISSVTTAHPGWTNKSSTYSNKFMRINATPLTTGGADTHSHTLTTNELPAHTHTVVTSIWGGADYAGAVARGENSNLSTITASSTGSGAAFTGDNVPTYVQVVVFQKD